MSQEFGGSSRASKVGLKVLASAVLPGTRESGGAGSASAALPPLYPRQN